MTGTRKYIFAVSVRTVLALVTAQAAPGCGGQVTANRPPVAFAGFDIPARPGMEFMLDGSLSNDPDGDDLTFRWELLRAPRGAGEVLKDRFSPGPRMAMTLEIPGLYVFGLTVNDGEFESATDQVNAFVLAEGEQMQVPIARSSANTWAVVGDRVTFSAGLVSGKPEEVVFVWDLFSRDRYSRLSGKDVHGSAEGSAWFEPDMPGEYVVSVHAMTGDLSGPPDFSSVMVMESIPETTPPIAGAMAVPSVANVSESVILSAESSMGAGNGTHPIESYDWKLVMGPDTTNGQMHGTKVQFTPEKDGLYIWELRVESKGLTSAPDLVAVSIR